MAELLAGVQAGSWSWRPRSIESGAVDAMNFRDRGRRAKCYDNAAMESFFHMLKVEQLHRYRYRTRATAKTAVFEYIEVCYNRKRKHSAIGHQIPMVFEQKSA